MKKYLISCLICVLSLPMLLCGCNSGEPLKDSPTTTAKTVVYGSALTYDDYVYYANSFVPYDTLKKGDNENATNQAMKRIKLDAYGKISQDDQNLPTNVEKVIGKIAASEHSFMYSSGEYIYFASPSTHLDSSLSTLFNCNSYFRVKTDGTGLKEFYTSSIAVTQQTVLKIANGDEYLILVDGENENKLVKIKLGSNIGKAETLVSGFSSAVFAKNYMNENDKFAYYLTELSEAEQTAGKTGSYLNKINLLTGEKTEKININQTRSITLKQVYDGKLFFVISEPTGETTLNPVFVELNNSSAFAYTPITAPLKSDATYSDYAIIKDQNGKYHYILSVNSKTYCLPENDKDMSQYLIYENGTMLFAYADYVYYKTDDGIYRANIRDFSDKHQISSLSSIKTETVAFDGHYIYYYAQNEYSSETYYLHRSQADLNVSNYELLSTLLDEDKPSDEETNE